MKSAAVLWLCALYCCIRNVEAASCPDGCDCVAYENSLVCDTSIDTLPLVTATNMTNTYLYVFHNSRLTRVKKNRLISTNLTYVYLDHNRISRIDNGAFKYIRNTSLLSISNNRLTTVHPKVFAPLSKLKFLDLSHNPIDSIADDTFKNLKTLSLLDVSDTLLTSLRFVVSIGAAVKQDAAYLLRVNASNNHRLKRLDEETVVVSMRMAALILLNNTNLVCYCKATNVQRLCRMTKSNYRYKWPVFVRTCYKPELERTMNGYHSNDAPSQQWYEYEDNLDTTVYSIPYDNEAEKLPEDNYFVKLYKMNVLLVRLVMLSVVLLVVFTVCVATYRRDRCSDAEANDEEREELNVVNNSNADGGTLRSAVTYRRYYDPMKPLEGDCGTEPTFEEYQQRHLHYATPVFPRPVVMTTTIDLVRKHENCKTLENRPLPTDIRKHEYENCKTLANYPQPLPKTAERPDYEDMNSLRRPPPSSRHDLETIYEEVKPTTVHDA